MPKQPLSRGFEPMRAGLAAGAGALLFVLALFMAAFTPNAPAAIVGLWRAGPVLAGSTVIIRFPDGYTGSGVYLGDGYVLTAAHNIIGRKADEARIETDDDQVSIGVEFMWANQQFDLGLIRQKEVVARPAKLACREPVIGEPVTVEGNPLNFGFVRTHGFIGSKSRPYAMWTSMFELDAIVAPGSSGGGVYDEWGEVIGVVVGVAPPFALGVAVPSSVACTLLAKDQPT